MKSIALVLVGLLALALADTFVEVVVVAVESVF